jgi:hypothetical protein
MSKRCVAVMLAASLLVAACDDDDPTGLSDRALIRGVNAAASTPSMDIFADVPPVVLLGDIAFNSASEDCEAVPEGDLALEVRATGGSNALASLTHAFVAGTSHQLVFFPNLTARLIEDDAEEPPDDVARLRFINATGTTFDVYASPPGTDAWAPQATLSNVINASASAFIDVPIENNRIRITPNTLERLLLDIPALDIPSDRILTVVITRNAAGAYGFTTTEPCL